MAEIAALIRKAQASTNHAVEVSERRDKEQPKQQRPPSTIPKEQSQPTNILADLDQIIMNLEKQKNMCTFGFPKEAREESRNIDESQQDYGDENDSFCYGAKAAQPSNKQSYTLPSDS